MMTAGTGKTCDTERPDVCPLSSGNIGDIVRATSGHLGVALWLCSVSKPPGRTSVQRIVPFGAGRMLVKIARAATASAI